MPFRLAVRCAPMLLTAVAIAATLDLSLALPGLDSPWNADPSKLPGVDVFKAKVEGYYCFRIPAIVRACNGDLLAFAEGRKLSCEDHQWNDIVMKRSTDNGTTWSNYTIIHGESSPGHYVTIGNPAPVILSNPSCTILLPFMRNNLDTLLINSTDNGHTWGSITDITSQVSDPSWKFIATGPPGSLQLSSGRILVPVDHITKEGTSYSMVIYSDDFGRTWSQSTAVERGNECQVALASNGSVVLNMRTVDPKRAVAISNDGGKTFMPAISTVTETNCEGSMISLETTTSAVEGAGYKSDNSILVMSSSFDSSRSNMTLHVSRDNGITWQPYKQIYPKGSAYSALVQMHPGQVGLLYERDSYNEITFALVDVE